MNFLDCEWLGVPYVEGVPISTSSTRQPDLLGPLTVGIRPEYLQVDASPGPNRVPAIITAVQDQGTQLMVQLLIGKRLAWSKIRNMREQFRTGPAFAYMPPNKCALYADDGRVA
jgi:hypothetical protein